MARHWRRPRAWMLAVGIPVVIVLLLVVAWGVDSAGAGGKVARNVSLAGLEVGRQSEADVRSIVADLAEAFESTEVRIDAENTQYTTTASELGVTMDQDATVAAVLDVGDDTALPLRPFVWAFSFAAARTVQPRFEVDETAFQATLLGLEGDSRVAPAEPSLVAGPTGVEAVIGVPGEGIDAAALADAVVAQARHGADPISVVATVASIAPRYSDAEARALADEANRITANPLEVRIGEETGMIPQPTMWSWMRAVAGPDDLELALDAPAVTATLQTLFPTVSEAADASFTVSEGVPVLIPSQNGTVCCEPDSAARILAALQAGSASAEVAYTVTVPAFTTEQAQALGIIEEVGQPGEFGPTTNHAAGEPRVTNIHRIADIIRGYIIRPGETFSINDYVGERTIEKGFVDAPVIYNGKFESDVGGGVSQFATTAFNAALYAGLEFGEYQSHSIQISRYPKGHEATISFPHPDLQIKNPTPYGVLVWPTYTASSITVHLYSTHNVDVSLAAPTSSSQGNCTRWTTRRTRTYLDGTTAEDSVFAVYRPGEGVPC